MSRPCSIEGCDHPANTRGWCRTHYSRWRRRGDPNAGPSRTRKLDREYVLGEIEWLKSFGVSPELICQSLGYRQETLQVKLNRWGRPDLARLFHKPQPEPNWARQYLEGRRRADRVA